MALEELRLMEYQRREERKEGIIDVWAFEGFVYGTDDLLKSVQDLRLEVTIPINRWCLEEILGDFQPFK